MPWWTDLSRVALHLFDSLEELIQSRYQTLQAGLQIGVVAPYAQGIVSEALADLEQLICIGQLLGHRADGVEYKEVFWQWGTGA